MGPYYVTIVVDKKPANVENTEMTRLVQKLDTYSELVAYQKAITDGVFSLAAQEISKRGSGDKGPDKSPA